MTDTSAQALLAVHELTRRAFLEGNAELVAPYIGDDEMAISDGRVRRETRDQWQQRFPASLRAAVYDRWDDVDPPRYGFSADGSMAWLVERVDMGGTRGSEPFVISSARLTVFEKREGRWRRVVSALTVAR